MNNYKQHDLAGFLLDFLHLFTKDEWHPLTFFKEISAHIWYIDAKVFVGFSSL